MKTNLQLKIQTNKAHKSLYLFQLNLQNWQSRLDRLIRDENVELKLAKRNDLWEIAKKITMILMH